MLQVPGETGQAVAKLEAREREFVEGNRGKSRERNFERAMME